MDERAAVFVVSDRLDVEIGRPRREDRLLMDRVDGHLRAAAASRRAFRRRRGGHAARVRARGADARRRGATGGASPRRGAAGRARAHAAGGRAGRPRVVALVRIRGRVQPLAVLNRDTKTVVRLSLEHADTVVRGREPIALAPRLSVQPVLGYDAAFKRTGRTLASASAGRSRIWTPSACTTCACRSGARGRCCAS
jgi:hypothetical protein